MNILICKDYEELSSLAAELLAEEIEKKPNLTLGLATGGTPVGLYKNLIKKHKENNLDFSNVKTFNLDEYLGLEKSDEQSYHYFMRKNLFDHINIKTENTNIPNGTPNDIELECQNYDDLINSSGIDIQILGIGENSHIAFNEPSNTFKNGTSLVNLTESTIQANARFFDSIEDVPTKALSMGIGSIFKAKKIILLASGENKAQAIYDTIFGDIDPKKPSSILKLHPDVVLVLDEGSAKLIKDKIKK